MKNLIFLAIALLFGLSAAKEKVNEPLNIIYINMDDLGIEETAPYGNKVIKTPNLSKMVKEGFMFTNHYAGTSVCAPSRCALMTGKHTGHTSIRGNIQVEPHGQMPLPDTEVTVAELLKTAGYQTKLFGKWGLGCENTEGEPTRQGFDEYYGYLDQVLAHNNFPEYLMHNGQKVPIGNKVIWEDTTNFFKGFGSFTPEPKVYSNDRFTEEAIKFLNQKHTKPFFLYLAYSLPHNNGEAPFEQRFQSPTLKPYENENWPEIDKHYAATVSKMDDYLGQIMKVLKEKGLDKNTLVFFTSDNGSTEDIPERFTINNKLRGYKRSPYEGGIKAPLIVWGPKYVPRNKVSHIATAQWDFLPTACEIAGVKSPSSIDGVSILPTLLGKKQSLKHKSLYWEFHEKNSWQAIRKDNYKLIYFHNTKKYELYDLASDTSESNNIIAKNEAIFNELKNAMKAERTDSQIFKF